MLRAAAVTVTAAAILLLTAVPASAHAGLEAAAPADGAQLSTAPEEVTLTFTEPLNPEFVQLAVLGPDGAPVTRGAARVDGPVVRQPVTSTADGAHTVAYRVVSTDGHPVSGQLSFTVAGSAAAPSSTAPSGGSTAPGTAAAAPTPAPDTAASTGGMAGWLPVVPVALVVGIGLVLLARRRRTTGD